MLVLGDEHVRSLIFLLASGSSDFVLIVSHVSVEAAPETLLCEPEQSREGCRHNCSQSACGDHDTTGSGNVIFGATDPSEVQRSLLHDKVATSLDMVVEAVSDDEDGSPCAKQSIARQAGVCDTGSNVFARGRNLESRKGRSNNIGNIPIGVRGPLCNIERRFLHNAFKH